MMAVSATPPGKVAEVAPRTKEPSQHTARNALLAGLLLLGIGALVARGCSESFVVPHEMERYLRQGPQHGAALLQQELERSYPRGSGIGPFFAHLERLGFDCTAALTSGQGGTCRYRAWLDARRLAVILVRPAHDGVVLRGVAVEMMVEAP